MSYGVVIGRFQVADLHPGHQHILKHASSKHDKLVVMLGTHGHQPTLRDPLQPYLRSQVIQAHFPEAIIKVVYDQPYDHLWSKLVDETLAEVDPNGEFVLYGSRDSFIPHYVGKHPVQEIECFYEASGTKERLKLMIANREAIVPPDINFRKGIIFAHASRFAISYQTTDTAVLDVPRKRVLLGQKKHDGEKLRFIGGFVDPSDISLEHAARREVYEETSGLETDDYRYVGSFRIDDYRFRGAEDRIMTTLFACRYIFGAPRPADDLDALQWVEWNHLLDVIEPTHLPLAEKLVHYLETLS